MNNLYYIESGKLNILLAKLKEAYRVFLPAIKDADSKEIDYFYKEASDGETLIFNSFRCVEPLKAFFTYPYEKISDYFVAEKNINEIAEKTIIFGVKSCDIAGHKVQDFVFLEGVEPDSLYRLRRENTILISGDCTDFKEVCHCLAWEILPYPAQGFDLNLSPLDDGYLAEAGSAKGEELIRQYQEYFAPAKENQLRAKDAKRENLIARLKKHLLHF